MLLILVTLETLSWTSVSYIWVRKKWLQLALWADITWWCVKGLGLSEKRRVLSCQSDGPACSRGLCWALGHLWPCVSRVSLCLFLLWTEAVEPVKRGFCRERAPQEKPTRVVDPGLRNSVCHGLASENQRQPARPGRSSHPCGCPMSVLTQNASGVFG